jgi:phosphotransferase system  glucose/maltose/N-acetylglucosamine-specific IIC component
MGAFEPKERKIKGLKIFVPVIPYLPIACMITTSI